MQFEKGKSGNPGGRGHVSSGRIKALATLDRVLAQAKNQTVLSRALAKEIRENPIGFFKTVVMPLLPREAQLSLDKGGVVRWRSLLEGDVVTRAPGDSAAGGVVVKPGAGRKE